MEVGEGDVKFSRMTVGRRVAVSVSGKAALSRSSWRRDGEAVLSKSLQGRDGVVEVVTMEAAAIASCCWQGDLDSEIWLRCW